MSEESNKDKKLSEDLVHSYISDREELIELLKYWVECALDMDFFIHWGSCFGSSDLRESDHAWLKVDQIAHILGHDGDAAVGEAMGEFKLKVGKRTWAMFRSGDRDLQEIVQGEAQPQIREGLGPYAQDYFRRIGQLELVDQIEAALDWQAMSPAELEEELGRSATTISEILSQHPNRFVSLGNGKWEVNANQGVHQDLAEISELSDEILEGCAYGPGQGR